MYKLEIISDKKLSKFTINELKELKEILNKFKKVDEFRLKKIKKKTVSK